MNKYNVGDKVRIKEDLVDNSLIYIRDDMRKHKGKIATITKSFLNDYKIDLDKGEWFWCDDNFEGLANETPKEIVITPKPKYVKCINDTGFNNILELNKIYEVLYEEMDGVLFYKLNINAHTVRWWCADRFIEVNLPLVKYVKCITNNFCCISKDNIYKVISESDDCYLIKTDKPSEGDMNYRKLNFIEVNLPVETVKDNVTSPHIVADKTKPDKITPTKPKSQKGTIKYKIKGDTTTVKFNGKIGKATRNSIDEPSIEIGILLATCRCLNIDENKIQDIIDVLFDDYSGTKAKCDNALMQNDIARAISILESHREVE